MIYAILFDFKDNLDKDAKEYYKMLLMHPSIFGGTAKEALDKYNKSLVLSSKNKRGNK